MNCYPRRKFLKGVAAAAATAHALRLHASPFSAMFPTSDSHPLEESLEAGWKAPAATYKQHTRWWWPGSAVTEEGIVWELDQMLQQGFGGVEIMNPWRFYTKGNVDYLSPEFLRLTQFTLAAAKTRGMEVSLNFGPGWDFGGSWVPPTERSKVLSQTTVELTGPQVFEDALPLYSYPEVGRDSKDFYFETDATDNQEMQGVVAALTKGDGLDGETLVDLTGHVENNRLRWEVPAGRWRLMIFRLNYTGQKNAATDNFPQQEWVVDHFSKTAMMNYCNYLGGAFYKGFGRDFGGALGTLFSDSFEVAVIPGTIHWSNLLLAQFRRYKGYDLRPYLPALWFDIGELTPKIRFDANDFLSYVAMQATFATFIDWCNQHRVEARMQPHYRFTEELIQGAGTVPRPEMECTTARFAVVPDPRKAIAAGAHLYGRPIVSAESFTFLHPERYRSTMEELKVATDAFLRDGVTQFYNHGYVYSPEMHIAPSRDVPWANRISHWNTWWKYYHYLTAYTARCCYMLRQGEFAGDVLLYSPQATVWTQKVVFNDDRRVMPYGDVGQVLVASGYDFDPVNDDILQNYATTEGGFIKVRGLSYRFLILPSIVAIPPKTLDFVERFVAAGGVLIALQQLPSSAVGLNDHRRSDAAVRSNMAKLFGADGKGLRHANGGSTHFLPAYLVPDFEATVRTFTPMEARHPVVESKLTPPQQQLVDILRQALEPDLRLSGDVLSQGLTFLHRKLKGQHVYFVTNLQAAQVATTVTFRVPNMIPECWNPMDGSVTRLVAYQQHAKGVDIPIQLYAFESRIFVFSPSAQTAHVVESNFDTLMTLDIDGVTGLMRRNGPVMVKVLDGSRSKIAQARVSDLPSVVTLRGPWILMLEGYRFSKLQRTLTTLASWTTSPESAHFSGTGTYRTVFDIANYQMRPDLRWTLNLGEVGNIAEVILNGKNLGTTWMQPYQIDVTSALRSGTNELEVLVTNTLINYVSGLQQLPEVPEDLVPTLGHTNKDYHQGAVIWQEREKNYHPLPDSGLLGPVRLIPSKQVTARFS